MLRARLIADSLAVGDVGVSAGAGVVLAAAEEPVGDAKEDAKGEHDGSVIHLARQRQRARRERGMVDSHCRP